MSGPYRDSDTLMPCPRCGDILAVIFDAVRACTRCDGLWLPQLVVQKAFTDPGWPRGPNAWWRQTRGCPECAASGIETMMASVCVDETTVDSCRAHGVWFDAGELRCLIGAGAADDDDVIVLHRLLDRDAPLTDLDALRAATENQQQVLLAAYRARQAELTAERARARAELAAERAREQAERERVERERAEEARRIRDQAERARLEREWAEQVEREQLMSEWAERARLERVRAERERARARREQYVHTGGWAEWLRELDEADRRWRGRQDGDAAAAVAPARVPHQRADAEVPTDLPAATGRELGLLHVLVSDVTRLRGRLRTAFEHLEAARDEVVALAARGALERRRHEAEVEVRRLEAELEQFRVMLRAAEASLDKAMGRR